MHGAAMKGIVRRGLVGLIILIVVLLLPYVSMDALNGGSVLAERPVPTPVPILVPGERRFVVLAADKTGTLTMTPATQNVSPGTDFKVTVKQNTSPPSGA